MSTVVGIDPGLSGALALISGGEYIDVVDMPTQTIKGKRAVCATGVAAVLRDYKARGADVAVVELVASRPKQGVASTFKFGLGTGTLHGALAALDIPYQLVTPQKWKAAARLIGKSKAVSISCARLLYPQAPLTLAKHDGRAEALLIATFGR